MFCYLPRIELLPGNSITSCKNEFTAGLATQPPPIPQWLVPPHAHPPPPNTFKQSRTHGGLTHHEEGPELGLLPQDLVPAPDVETRVESSTHACLCLPHAEGSGSGFSLASLERGTSSHNDLSSPRVSLIGEMVGKLALTSA